MVRTPRARPSAAFGGQINQKILLELWYHVPALSPTLYSNIVRLQITLEWLKCQEWATLAAV
jgi:hypothetical protein